MTKIGSTVVDHVHRACFTTESIRAGTAKAAMIVVAGCTIRARHRQLTFVDILLAYHPGEAGGTDAFNSIVLLTRCSILTGLGVTKVGVYLAGTASKPRVALT